VAQVTIPLTKLTGSDCSEENLAAVLKANGYRTGMVGKWHLGENTRFASYADQQEAVRACGFHFVEALYSENIGPAPGGGVDIAAARSSANTGMGPAARGPMAGMGPMAGIQYSHNMELVTSEALRFIEAEDETPFFLYFNPTGRRLNLIRDRKLFKKKVPHPARDVAEALENYSCRAAPNGSLDADPLVKGMTLEHGSCEAYRETIFERAGGSRDSHDLGAIWVLNS